MDEERQEQDFEIFAENHSTSPDDLYFDAVVLALQDTILDAHFESLQAGFMRKHCLHFRPEEENKPEHMLIFNLYQQEIEHYVQQQLASKLPDFSMPRFVALLEQRPEQVDEQLLDMIESFSEFESFKKVMLEYRQFLSNEEQLRGLWIKSTKMG